ncbi:hypothetical protein NCAS_0A04250 [Naumovozyma castellii]|uniref:COX assembly mitochondrial protein n=1 Tax=Naumovozyma castellii TaxID=27288 RepID=G0V691_NAUCA|nr:hypothetical protein NCAS_0A04250 [Naumovozyma castellii CBS 4309]CCC66983.1 hypothetical protein NCAS_0A04250 [Naumovozyma castellii CBS 4309]
MEQPQMQQSIKHNSPLPIWALTPGEEKKARKNLKTMAYGKCGEYIKALADCAKENGIKVFPTCDPQRIKMKDCLLFYQTDPKFLDEERDKVILEKINSLEKRLKESKLNNK